MYGLIVLFFCAVGFMAGALIVGEALLEGFMGMVKDFRGE